MMATRRQFLFGHASPAGAPLAGAGCLERQGIVCQACRDTCPERAIGFRPGGAGAPVIDPARCNACGACLPACPVGAIAFEPAAA